MQAASSRSLTSKGLLKLRLRLNYTVICVQAAHQATSDIRVKCYQMLLFMFQFHPRLWSKNSNTNGSHVKIRRWSVTKFWKHSTVEHPKFNLPCACCTLQDSNQESRKSVSSMFDLVWCQSPKRLSKHPNQLQLSNNSVTKTGIKASVCYQDGLPSQTSRHIKCSSWTQAKLKCKTQVPGQHIQRFQVVIQNFK